MKSRPPHHLASSRVRCAIYRGRKSATGSPFDDALRKAPSSPILEMRGRIRDLTTMPNYGDEQHRRMEGLIIADI